LESVAPHPNKSSRQEGSTSGQKQISSSDPIENYGAVTVIQPPHPSGHAPYNPPYSVRHRTLHDALVSLIERSRDPALTHAPIGTADTV
jgi:hypothetical protein